MKVEKNRPPKNNGGLIGDIVEKEGKYINQTDTLVEVSFRIHSHDWKKLKKSIPWRLVEKELWKNRRVNAKVHKVPKLPKIDNAKVMLSLAKICAILKPLFIIKNNS